MDNKPHGLLIQHPRRMLYITSVAVQHIILIYYSNWPYITLVEAILKLMIGRWQYGLLA